MPAVAPADRADCSSWPKLILPLAANCSAALLTAPVAAATARLPAVPPPAALLMPENYDLTPIIHQ